MCSVSVILPVYNAENTIKETINSILYQSYSKFELLIIDDGSTDRSLQYIKEFNDDRIRLFINETNLKLIKTLNRGIELATGKYIVRMDADDIMYPTRIEEQVNFMEKNPNISASGTWIRTFGLKSKRVTYLPAKNEQILIFSFIDSPIFHPTAIIRRNVLCKYNIRYNYNYPHAEDYKFWMDLLKYGELGNLKKILLRYRISNIQISSKYSKEQVESAIRIRTELIREILENKKMDLDIKFTLEYLKYLDVNYEISSFKDAKIYSMIVFILFMSLYKYNISSFLYFIKSIFRFKYHMSIKQVVLVCLKHIFHKKWYWYSISR